MKEVSQYMDDKFQWKLTASVCFSCVLATKDDVWLIKTHRYIATLQTNGQKSNDRMKVVINIDVG